MASAKALKATSTKAPTKRARKFDPSKVKASDLALAASMGAGDEASA